MKLFDFEAKAFSAQFLAQDYVHIPEGLTQEFYDHLKLQVEESASYTMSQFAVGNKQQALYQFPDQKAHLQEFLEGVGAVCGLDAKRLVIAERHIKSYEPNANPYPLAHKDRFATEVSVGFSVNVPPGSTLVLYPNDDVSVNPFQSSAELRASLDPEQVPEVTLKNARRVEIQDSPRDIIMFRGNAIWHLRERPANTVMVYFKLNTFNSDPLGEDPRTPDYIAQTRRLLQKSDEDLANLIPVLSRRVDYIHRRYNHHWTETIGVVLQGEKHFTISEGELAALRRMDGLNTVAEVISPSASVKCIRRLGARGVIDLLPGRVAVETSGESRHELNNPLMANAAS